MVKILTRSRFRHLVAREAADPVRTDAVTVWTDKSTVLTDEIGSTSSCESEENCKSSHKSLNAVTLYVIWPVLSMYMYQVLADNSCDKHRLKITDFSTHNCYPVHHKMTFYLSNATNIAMHLSYFALCGLKKSVLLEILFVKSNFWAVVYW